MALQLPSGFKEKYGSKYTSSPLLGKANVYGCPPRPFPPVVSPTSLAKPVALQKEVKWSKHAPQTVEIHYADIGCMENRQTAEPEQHKEIPKVS